MKVLRIISRIIVGLVFIFSGTVKAIDPMGTVYKFQDYFHAFSLDFLSGLSFLAAVILCSAEFIGGFSVLFNIRQKTGIWIIMILMLIFTPLTFVLALTNPVSDCGCFGDAIHLTNWQTFFKNIILLIPAVYLFITRRKIIPHQGITREWAIISVMILVFISFILYNLRYLPVIDFLPYKTGTYIPDKMVIPEGVAVDRYETTFIYEKNGEKKEFTLDNYPSGDTTWKFVEQRSMLVSKGYVPPIHDLSMVTRDGADLTQQILSSEKPALLMIARKLEKADSELLRAGFELGGFCASHMIDFYILTASGADQVNKFNNGLTFCFTDETTLKTMIRSNPGYMLLKKGTVTGKWSWANIPGKDELLKLLNTQ
jgi:Methylamine utilisation protein MauE